MTTHTDVKGSGQRTTESYRLSMPFEARFEDPETGIEVRVIWSFKTLKFQPVGADLSRRFTRGQIAVTASRCEKYSRTGVWDGRDVSEAVEAFSGRSIWDFIF